MLLPSVVTVTVGDNLSWAGCQRALVAQQEGQPFHRLATPPPRVTNNAVDVRVHFYSRWQAALLTRKALRILVVRPCHLHVLCLCRQQHIQTGHQLPQPLGGDDAPEYDTDY